MDDTPTQRKPPPTLDRRLSAHERRARIIAQLRKQAIAGADDLSAQHKAAEAENAKAVKRRRAFAWLSVAAAVVWGLCCIIALSRLVIKGL